MRVDIIILGLVFVSLTATLIFGQHQWEAYQETGAIIGLILPALFWLPFLLFTSATLIAIPYIIAMHGLVSMVLPDAPARAKTLHRHITSIVHAGVESALMANHTLAPTWTGTLELSWKPRTPHRIDIILPDIPKTAIPAFVGTGMAQALHTALAPLNPAQRHALRYTLRQTDTWRSVQPRLSAHDILRLCARHSL